MSIAIEGGWGDLTAKSSEKIGLKIGADRGINLLTESTKIGLRGLQRLSDHIAYSQMSSTINKFITRLDIKDEELSSALLLIGHKDAYSNNRSLNILSDILNSKRLLIYLLEQQPIALNSSIHISTKEKRALGSDVAETNLNLENLVRTLLAAIYNIENLLVMFMTEIIVSFEGVDINGEFVMTYEVFANAIQVVKNSKKHFDGESQYIPDLIECFMEDKLNFHLISKTNLASTNGDVLFQGLKVNHDRQKKY